MAGADSRRAHRVPAHAQTLGEPSPAPLGINLFSVVTHADVVESKSTRRYAASRQRERSVILVEPVRMNNVADVKTLVDTQPRRLAVEVRDVSLTFETADGKVEALSKVNLQIADGEFVS